MADNKVCEGGAAGKAARPEKKKRMRESGHPRRARQKAEAATSTATGRNHPGALGGRVIAASTPARARSRTTWPMTSRSPSLMLRADQVIE